MEYQQLGRTRIRVSTVALGTWVMGGKEWAGVDDADSIAAIHAALDHGVTLIDTAEVYGNGHAEEIVGRALRGRRDRAVIATKSAMWHAEPDKARAALDGSLRRLQTDYVDLYQVHWPHPEVPFEETMGAFEDLRRAGKIRAVGVSNFDVAATRRCMDVGTVDSLQPPYSLFWRGAERELLPFCREHSISVLAYSPLAQGLLTGKFTAETRFESDDIRSRNVLFSPGVFEFCLERVDRLREIAARYGRTPAQAAVRWLLDRPGMTSAILGARTPRQVEENVGAVGWTLDPADAEEIDRLGREVADHVPDHDTLWGPRWY